METFRERRNRRDLIPIFCFFALAELPPYDKNAEIFSQCDQIYRGVLGVVALSIRWSFWLGILGVAVLISKFLFQMSQIEEHEKSWLKTMSRCIGIGKPWFTIIRHQDEKS